MPGQEGGGGRAGGGLVSTRFAEPCAGSGPRTATELSGPNRPGRAAGAPSEPSAPTPQAPEPVRERARAPPPEDEIRYVIKEASPGPPPISYAVTVSRYGHVSTRLPSRSRSRPNRAAPPGLLIRPRSGRRSGGPAAGTQYASGRRTRLGPCWPLPRPGRCLWGP